jgi:pyruvate dehydrogenase E2 component (dihydrolipoamide acetyltransferase)
MEVLMPQLGETVAEGKITVWFKSVGDRVAPGDNLFEIETDKVSMEVPATSAGILQEIRVRQGEVAPVSAIVAIIGDAIIADNGSGAPSTRTPTPAKPAPAALEPYNEVHTPARNFGPARLANGVTVSPLARRLAVEAGVDLANVKGSGPHGRIHAADVKAVRAIKAVTPSITTPAPITTDAPFERIPLDAMRRTIARRLVEAKQTIPHFYLTSDIDITRLLALREEANGAQAVKLSINDFIIKGLALALQRVPAANAVWAESAEAADASGAAIIRYRHSDVGVAVAVEGGLFTPVIRRAESKSLAAISAEMKDLAARARERKLQPHEYQGGVTTISNLGMYGVREFSAIINPPQSTILAVGAGQRRVVETSNGENGFATLMTVTLSCDHRVVDGALGAQLLAALKAVLENPITLFV